MARIFAAILLAALASVSEGTMSLQYRADGKNRWAVFNKLSGKVLSGFVIAKHQVTSPVWCAQHCLENMDCASYNVRNAVTCELNNETMATQNASLQSDPEGDHYFPAELEYKSCLDHMKAGATDSGIYTITFSNGARGKVMCDLTSEPNAAWTLVLSFAFKNRHLEEFYKKPWQFDAPRHSDEPNWDDYRIELAKMQHLVKQSTHWRATTGLPVYGVDYRDYIRGLLSSLYVFADVEGCRDVEYVNVRGYSATNSSVYVWQDSPDIPLHIDTDYSYAHCRFKHPNYVTYENIFGLYSDRERNPKFRGSEDDGSTTQWWFGGYLN
ncbi:uncharacterized protein LOC116614948 [Nematostella vectensis]|uniref:uncharacterized protein LOC116614948 n=1 Tax=Nematostella vectensis TaxID=45351 RepID=UPI0013904248|nr:uncharacterized protein LOC116614948 [Nematostella vectensis]XP_032232463.1 uncharacterized protein LOC116614948 [Nematostella vectensis]XP_032232464.1 uncharacterized protein LOC116614948 [Nematostella vectensis]XP_048577534.1 uncharacterized protein LOC116614948 [Nematostella vectensis]XP_048577535.1 uncharacterized protein LOC116614948 [Nematostella vectensis]XP_048577536.1 uncharacterized protein LOC116614948 [Nematostella vectensis]